MRENDIEMSFSQLGVVGTWGWLRVPVYIHHYCMEYFATLRLASQFFRFCERPVICSHGDVLNTLVLPASIEPSSLKSMEFC